MRDKIKEFIKSDEEIKLWEEIWNAFQENGIEGLTNTVQEKAENIKKEFDEIYNKIKKEIWGDL